MKIILLFFFGVLPFATNAQLIAHISHRQNHATNSNELLHDVCIKTYPNRNFTLQFNYYIGATKVDSFVVHTISDEAKFYNNYWHFTIAHVLPIANYQCHITAVEEATKEQFFKIEDISMSNTDSISFSPISLFIQDSSVSFLPSCIENFCDTSINTLIVKTTLLNTKSIKEDVVFYLRISKKGKLNTILYSTQDTIAVKDFTTKKNYVYKATIPLEKLATGNFTASIVMLVHNSIKCSTQVNFQCIRPIATLRKIESVEENYLQTSNTEIETSFVAKYDLPILKKNLLSLQGIVVPSQYNVILQLCEGNNDTMMRRYFYNFWSNKNIENPEKLWKDYTIQLNECVKNYGSINCDQAFIYLRYGKPDKVETVLNEPYTIPYEIWQYEQLGATQNVVFLFIQKNGANNQMNLLHSTHPLEKQYLQWQRFLIKGEPQSNRVLEYLDINGKSR